MQTIRTDNPHFGINFDASIPLGKSKVTVTTDAQIKSYTYFPVFLLTKKVD